jgi:ribonuclease HI
MKDAGDFTIYTDGAARGNPGPAAYAFVIQRPGQSDVEENRRLGEATNNVAEYTALIKALERAKESGGRRLTIHSDSELMVNQMNGAYKVKNAGLLPLYNEAQRLARDFERVDIRHIRREENSRADQLCNDALDGMESVTPVPRKPVPQPNSEPATTPPVHRQAVAYLEQQAARWAEGDPERPLPADVWQHLWNMVREAGVVRADEKVGRSTRRPT